MEKNEIACRELATRKGKTMVSWSMLEMPDAEVLRALFTSFFPVETVPGGWLQRETTFMGYSPLFRSLKEGEALPTYEFTFMRFTLNNDGDEKIEVQKVEEIKE